MKNDTLKKLTGKMIKISIFLSFLHPIIPIISYHSYHRLSFNKTYDMLLP